VSDADEFTDWMLATLRKHSFLKGDDLDYESTADILTKKLKPRKVTGNLWSVTLLPDMP
jgi:hypothetical protein